MTKLEQAFANARSLPPEQQDVLAAAMDDFVHAHTTDYQLTDEQVAEVEAAMVALKEGRMDTISGPELDAFWKRLGL